MQFSYCHMLDILLVFWGIRDVFSDLTFLRYAITDMRKLANRMQFGVPEESSLGKYCCLEISKIFEINAS